MKWFILCTLLVACSSDDSDKDAKASGQDQGLCSPGLIACNGKCVDWSTDEANCGMCGRTCNEAEGFICSDKECICAAESAEDCGGTCVDLATDKAHCGACGADCGDGMTCSNGNCVGQ